MAPQNPQRPYQPAPPGVYPQPVVPQQPVYPQPVMPQQGVPQGVPGQAYPQPVPQYPPQQPYPAQAYPQPAYPQPVQPQQPYAVPNQPIYPNQPIPNQPVMPQQPYAVPNQPLARAQPMPAPAQAMPAPAHAMPAPPRPLPGAPAQPMQAQPMPIAAAAAAGARPMPVNAPVPVGAAGARPVPAPAKAPGAAKAKKNTNGDEEEDAEKQTAEAVAIRKAPPWLVSAIVHAVGLIMAGLIYFSLPGNQGVNLKVIFAEDIGVQLDNTDLTTGLMEPVDIIKPEIAMDASAVSDPFAAPPILDVTLDGVTASSDIQAPSIGMALTGREKGMKKALLGKYGGNATTEEAVKRALEWLKRNQEKEGTWSLVGPYSSPGQFENKTAATAMALLAFQGAGNTHKTGEFKAEVAKGWKAFIKMQDKDGMFQVGGVHNHRLYAQAQATIALCELYGMTKDKEYKQAAQKAIDYAVKAQDASGGWRYMPGQDADTSVTGWFVMALQSGLMAGLEVPSPTLEKIMKYLDSVALEDGTRYTYRPGGGDTPTMTAEALLCREYLGWKHDDPRLTNGINYVNNNPIDWNDQNVYYWYYATQATHHMEGEHWNKWNKVMRQTLPEHQEKTGKEAGSWNPSNDRWGDHGGRLFTTCLCTYMLEVYYRHLPIYKYRAQ